MLPWLSDDNHDEQTEFLFVSGLSCLNSKVALYEDKDGAVVSCPHEPLYSRKLLR